MIRNNILFRIGVRTVLSGGDLPKGNEMSELVLDTYLKSLTLTASGQEFESKLFEPSHPIAVKVITSVTGSIWDHLIEIEKNSIKKLAILMAYKRDNQDDLDRYLHDLLTVYSEDESSATGIWFEGLKDKLQGPSGSAMAGFGDLKLIDRFCRPILLGLYTAPLIDLRHSVLPTPARARISAKVSDIFDFMIMRMNPDRWQFVSDKIGGAYGEGLEVFQKKHDETKDPFYLISRWLFAQMVKGLQDINNDEEFWLEEIDSIKSQLLEIHSDCYRYLSPVYRKLFFDSFLPTGMTEAEHLSEMRIVSRRLKGLSDFDIPEATREEQLKDAFQKIAELDPEMGRQLRELRQPKTLSVLEMSTGNQEIATEPEIISLEDTEKEMFKVQPVELLNWDADDIRDELDSYRDYLPDDYRYYGLDKDIDFSTFEATILKSFPDDESAKKVGYGSLEILLQRAGDAFSKEKPFEKPSSGNIIADIKPPENSESIKEDEDITEGLFGVN